MSDFLEDKKREINARLKELRPLVDEFHRLEAAATALQGVEATPSGDGGRARRGSARTRAGATGGRRRTRGGGTRSHQALELVRNRPGISIPEIAQEMGIQQNYLYRVLPGLERDGLVRKDGRGWHPREAVAEQQ